MLNSYFSFCREIRKKAVGKLNRYRLFSSWEKYKEITADWKSVDDEGNRVYDKDWEISMSELGLERKNGYGNIIFAGQF